eukprot:UN33120
MAKYSKLKQQNEREKNKIAAEVKTSLELSSKIAELQKQLEAERKRSKDLEQSLSAKENQLLTAIGTVTSLERLIQLGGHSGDLAKI